MYYKQLEGFLRDKTAEYSAEMQEIIGGIVPVYNSGADEAMNASIKDAYRHITSIVDSWCKLVLQMEMLEYENNSAHLSLRMAGIQDPLNLHKLDACVEHIQEFFEQYKGVEG